METKNTQYIAGGRSDAPTCSPFFRGQRIKHKLNGTTGIITIQGMKYNAGQTWRVRFERVNGFEEVEMQEWEILPDDTDHATADIKLSTNQ